MNLIYVRYINTINACWRGEGVSTHYSKFLNINFAEQLILEMLILFYINKF